MAKTRIKTTPMRMQKDALMAMATAAEHAKKLPVPKQQRPITYTQRQLALEQKHKANAPTILITKPGPNSRSSTTSSNVSHYSDIQSITSGSESSLPTSPIRIASTSPPPLLSPSYPSNHHIIHASNEVIIETSTSTNQLSSLLNGNGTDGRNENRKVFMITTDDSMDATSSVASNGGSGGGGNGAGGGGTAQKRKMFLIMEEDTKKNDNVLYENSSTNDIIMPPIKKKLTIFANKSDREFPQKFEKILPEILSRIQARMLSSQSSSSSSTSSCSSAAAITNNNNNNTKANGVNENHHEVVSAITTLNYGEENDLQYRKSSENHFKSFAPLTSSSNQGSCVTVPDHKERLPITLPPKKNRTKININNLENFPQEVAYKSPVIQQNCSSFEVDQQNYDIEYQTEDIIVKHDLQSSESESNEGQVYDVEIYPQTVGSKFHKMQKINSHYQQLSAATPVIVTNSTLLSNSKNLSNKNTLSNVKVNESFSLASCEASIALASPPPLYVPKPNNIIEIGDQVTFTPVKTSSQLRKSINTPPPLVALKPTAVSKPESTPSDPQSPATITIPASLSPHCRNINLSTDFLFLLKILPKLESIQEPRKSYIKNCIEDMLTQNASLFKTLSL